MSNMKKSDVKALIEQELNAVREGKSDDEEYTPDESDIRFLETKEKVSEEEAIIDELLLSVPRSQGYYLKLMKEIRPNEYEFKLRLDNYESWSDLEYEISNVVRSYTLKQPHKWGSGHYRVIVWRDGGMRGPKHKPIDFYVDAMEQEVPGAGTVTSNQSRDIESQLSSLSGLIESVKKLSPPQPESLSPADIQRMINEAYTSGLANAEKKANDNANIMTAMMTGMFGLIGTILTNQNKPVDVPRQADPIELMAKLTETMKNLGLAGTDRKEKSLTEHLQDMQMLGLWKQPKDEDPLAKISELKTVFDMVSDLGGLSKGERPSTMEKVIDVIGPRVPEMIGNITNTINNAIDYSKVRMGLPNGNQPTRRVIKPAPTEALPTVEQPNGEQNMSEQSQAQMDAQQQMKLLFDELYGIIASNDTSKFDHIANRISMLMGPQALQDIAVGRLPKEMIANVLSAYGDDRYRDQTFQHHMTNYLSKFVEYVGTKFLPQAVVAVCSTCQAEYEFPSNEEFDADPKNCDTPGCTGTLVKANVNDTDNGTGTSEPVDMNPNNYQPVGISEPVAEPHNVIDMNPYSTH